MSKRGTLLGIVVAAALTACATEKPATDAAPPLFVALDTDSTIYLFGTVHLRQGDSDWSDPQVEAALNRATDIWTEVDTSPQSQARGQAAAAQLGAAQAGQPLSSWLDTDGQARLGAMEQRLGLPAGNLEQMRPWLASLTLTLVPMMRAGDDPQAGVDREVVAWGVAHGRTMHAFETAEQQVRMFADQPPAAQRGMLLDAIAHGGEGPARGAALSAAWRQGDLRQVEALTIAELHQKYPAFYQSLYAGRNRAWTDVLMHELQGSGVAFVAVGVGHLVGPDGLVAQLRAQDVHVERVR